MVSRFRSRRYAELAPDDDKEALDAPEKVSHGFFHRKNKKKVTNKHVGVADNNRPCLTNFETIDSLEKCNRESQEIDRNEDQDGDSDDDDEQEQDDEKEQHEDNEEKWNRIMRKRKAFKWWKRLDSPTRKDLIAECEKEEVDLAPEDVDLLPWIAGGFYIDLPSIMDWIEEIESSAVLKKGHETKKKNSDGNSSRPKKPKKENDKKKKRPEGENKTERESEKKKKGKREDNKEEKEKKKKKGKRSDSLNGFSEIAGNNNADEFPEEFSIMDTEDNIWDTDMDHTEFTNDDEDLIYYEDEEIEKKKSRTDRGRKRTSKEKKKGHAKKNDKETPPEKRRSKDSNNKSRKETTNSIKEHVKKDKGTQKSEQKDVRSSGRSSSRRPSTSSHQTETTCGSTRHSRQSTAHSGSRRSSVSNTPANHQSTVDSSRRSSMPNVPAGAGDNNNRVLQKTVRRRKVHDRNGRSLRKKRNDDRESSRSRSLSPIRVSVDRYLQDKNKNQPECGYDWGDASLAQVSLPY